MYKYDSTCVLYYYYCMIGICMSDPRYIATIKYTVPCMVAQFLIFPKFLYCKTEARDYYEE